MWLNVCILFAGEVLLDKISTARTVVNKLNTIDNTYRNFEMEVIAGAADFMVKTREHGNTFEFDFSKVYWNPRLSKCLMEVFFTSLL